MLFKMRSFIFIISILFSFAAFAQSGDTLTLKDCNCRRYDRKFDLCSVTVSKGQVFAPKQLYITHKILSPWVFSIITQAYETPYGKKNACTWSRLVTDLPICFYALLFFIENKKA